MSKKLYIGLVGVRPMEGNDCLGDSRGAFVNVIALAEDEEDYLRQLEEALEEFRFYRDEIEDVEPYSSRLARGQVEDGLDEIARKVADDGYSRFGSFFVYENDDA